MTATLAKLAGCPEIVVFTPSNADGVSAVLAALHLLGIEEVYRVGGAQAIGALAFGTTTIAPVDKIFRPGNAYVCEAKRQVFGFVGVDSLPGLSEVMVIADETAKPSFVAADLLAQAEHRTGREKVCLVSTSGAVIASVLTEMRTSSSSSGAPRRRRGSWSRASSPSRPSRSSRPSTSPTTSRPSTSGCWSPDADAKKLTDAVTTAHRHHARQPLAHRVGRLHGGPQPRPPRRAAPGGSSAACAWRTSCVARASSATTRPA